MTRSASGETYWSRFAEQGYYFAGDGAKYDDDGAIWLLGRVDDVMNISGHRISTTEVESALVVASDGGRGRGRRRHGPDDRAGHRRVRDPARRRRVRRVEERGGARSCATTSRKEIGPIAKPRQILVVPELPKTRSGKIMRRLLRDVAENRDVGDVTTLADYSVMNQISSGLQSGKAED